MTLKKESYKKRSLFMKKIYIEAPCFGFGPTSTSISLANSIGDKFDIAFITYGEALDFLIQSTNYSYVEIDTRDEQNFVIALEKTADADAYIVNTNIEFAEFLLKNNKKTLIVDTLYWMWNSAPSIYVDHKYFIQQVYYGDRINNFPDKLTCKPLIDYKLWHPHRPNTDQEALIAFGGMAEPGDHPYFLDYSCWLVNYIEKLIPESIKKIHVVGGLFNRSRSYDFSERVKVWGSLTADKFNSIVKQSKYIFQETGLTSLYEMLSSQRLFCLLPGLSVSQVYQGYEFERACDYAHCLFWPQMRELVERFSVLPELDGLAYLENYLVNRLNRNNLNYDNIIKNYINSVDNHEYIPCKITEQIFSFPSITDLATGMLFDMLGE